LSGAVTGKDLIRACFVITGSLVNSWLINIIKTEASSLGRIMNKLQRFNVTRPFVEGVHTKRYNPKFIAWFEEHKEDYADWFVKRVQAGDTHCMASAVHEWEQATENYNY